MVKLSFDTLPCVGTGAYREYIATLEACLNRALTGKEKAGLAQKSLRYNRVGKAKQTRLEKVGAAKNCREMKV